MYYSLKISLTIIRTYVWFSSICCPQHYSPFADSPSQIPLHRFPFADFPLQIPRSQFPKLPPHLPLHKLLLHLPLRKLSSYLPLRIRHRICSWRICQRICLVQTSSHSCGLANLRSPWVQSSSQDCRVAVLRSTLGANFIARLRLRSARGQTSSPGFARAPPLVEGHRTICPWPFGESPLTNLSSHDRLLTDLRSALPFPRLPLRVWASFFHAEHFPSHLR